MKKCFIMFAFLVLSLLLAILSDNSNEVQSDRIASIEKGNEDVLTK